jgi:hypothetical protein
MVHPPRPGTRVVSHARFQPVATTAELVERFFGPPLRPSQAGADVAADATSGCLGLPRNTGYDVCMTMLSFRVDKVEAAEAQRWAEELGVDRSELLRDALHRHLLRLASENDAKTWVEQPLDAGEQSLSAIAEWGPAEDWSGWADATG